MVFLYLEILESVTISGGLALEPLTRLSECRCSREESSTTGVALNYIAAVQLSCAIRTQVRLGGRYDSVRGYAKLI